MNLSELPDFFALEHLAKALWRDGESRGAALLVGSGFSRFARLPGGDSKKAPLWNDLRRSIVGQIYAGAKESEIPTDPLRLAEEYRAMLGQAALDDFIRTQIPDQSWEPGEMHELLLRLPWADVLTTNWDTLLERTAPSVGEIAYETVRTPGDLARARAPRIVKLHGTLPSGPFIFAEEDYRIYPTRHAAFVNLARQVFLENELCLLGFSGNDPNFLQWSGWVRDHLGGSARRIYLIGVLNLRAATRRLLEQRNVAPIDLAPLVQDADPAERHAKATRIFLEYLKNAEPRPLHSWSPQRLSHQGQTTEETNRRMTDKKYGAQLLLEQMKAWQSDRETYPGWLICPDEKRNPLRYNTTESFITKGVLDAIEPKHKHRLLYELAWRFDKAFWPIPDFVFEALYGVAESGLTAGASDVPADSRLSIAEYLELASTLLRAARHANNWPSFDKLAILIEQHSQEGSDYRAEIAYQKCLRLRDRLQYSELFKMAPAIEGPDPVWKLRQANICCEFGDFAPAKQLIFDALAELRLRQQRDRRSLWVLSRRAWAEYLARAADFGISATTKRKDFDRDRDWPLDFKAAKCDPWDERQQIDHDIDKEFRDRDKPAFDLKPHFDAGTFSEGGQGTTIRSWTVVSPSYEFDRLSEEAGLPVALDWTSIRGDDSKKALALSFDGSEEWYLRLLQTLRSHSDPFLEKYLDRVSVAKLDKAVANSLIDTCLAAIQFWRTRTTYLREDVAGKSFNSRAIEEIRFFIEVLSRLVIRTDPEKAQSLYDLCLEFVKEPDLRHWWLLEPISHLLQRSGEAMPPSQRAELILRALQFPLLSDLGYQGPEYHWPTPMEYIANVKYQLPKDSVAWHNRISELVQAVRNKRDHDRPEAALRLCQLNDRQLLTPEEQKAFGEALFAQLNADQVPGNTNLYLFVVLKLPAPDPDFVNRRFREIAFTKPKDQIVTLDFLHTIKGAALLSPPNAGTAVLPDHDGALKIMDAMLEWRPKQSTRPFDFEQGRSKQIAREIGPCFVHAVAPLLASVDLSTTRIDGFFLLISEAAPSMLQGLPAILRLKPELLERATKAIRRAMMANTFDAVWSATHALERWAANVHEYVPIPRSLIDQLVLAISSRQKTGLYHLLHCARRFATLGLMDDAQKSALAEALSDLFVETAYGSVESPELAISLSITRAECVRLAQTLSKTGSSADGISLWLAAYKDDPLPEVRFALDNLATNGEDLTN